MRGNRLLALVAERNTNSDPGPEDLHRIGTVGAIHQLHRVPDGTVRLMVQGIERIRLVEFTGTEPYLVARVEVLKDQTDQATEVDALRRAVVDVFRRLVEASAEMPDEMATAAENLSDPRHDRPERLTRTPVVADADRVRRNIGMEDWREHPALGRHPRIVQRQRDLHQPHQRALFRPHALRRQSRRTEMAAST
jgi:ATP-dependent Lon protease